MGINYRFQINLNALVQILKQVRPAHIIILFGFITYTVFWSRITLSRIYSLHASVFDLGVFGQSLLRIIHGNLHYIAYMSVFAPFRIFISPLELLPGLSQLVIFQTFFLALPVFFVFGIAKKSGLGDVSALLLSFTYLIYFPLSGVNWFDVHGQAFFIFFFMAGYYFWLMEKYKLAIFLLLLSGLVRFPYLLFPMGLGALFIVQYFFKNIKFKDEKATRFLKSSFLLFVFAFILLVISYTVQYKILIGTIPISGAIHYIPGQSVFTNIDIKIFTVLLFFFPFFPIFFKPKWLLFILPFLTLLFITNNLSYQFPVVITDQYPSMIIPFLFIGAIDGLASIKESNPSVLNGKKRMIRYVKNSVFKNSAIILIIVLLLGSVYQPYSPLDKNSSVYNDFNYSVSTDINTTEYNALNSLVSLIPTNNPYVLMQNIMPEVLIRDPAIYSAYSDSVFGFPHNLTFQVSNGSWTSEINYAIADIGDPTIYQSAPFPGNLSMYQVLQRLYASGNYSIIAQNGTFVLLKNGYFPASNLLAPLSYDFNASQLGVLNNAFRHKGFISATNLHGHRLWYADTSFLPPGSYTARLDLSASNISKNNSISIWIGDYPYFVFKQVSIGGGNLSTVNTSQYISVNFTTNNFWDQVQVAGLNVNWNGTLTIYGLSIRENAMYPVPSRTPA